MGENLGQPAFAQGSSEIKSIKLVYFLYLTKNN